MDKYYCIEMDPNERTLGAYERNVDKFIELTPKDTIGDTKLWLDLLIDKVNADSDIFEIGSGFGRDAQYMESRGLTVQCSDGAPGFLGELASRGLKAQYFNALTDPFPGKYDLIFADAVFEHFTRQQFEGILNKVHGATNEDGTLGFCVRRGDGEYWTSDKLDEERYFCLWQPDSLAEQIRDANFVLDTIIESTGYLDIERLYVVANKKS